MDRKVGKQDNTIQDITSRPSKISVNIRDKVFQHAISLIDNETNSTYNMLMENSINTILDFLSMPFKNIEGIEDRVDKKCIKLSLTNTNKLKVLESFYIYKAQKGSPLNVNDWMNLDKNEFEECCLTYQEKYYNIDTT